MTREGTVRALLVGALVGLAWWCFGNLYEAVVISPNWVVDSPAQLERLNNFFTVTSPTLYFVPVTGIALVALWLAAALGRELPGAGARYGAVLVSIALLGLNVTIVSLLITALFGPGYQEHGHALAGYAWWWNAGNALRIALTATTGVLVWRSLVQLDRAVVAAPPG